VSAARQLSATPPFAGLRVCAGGCGTILSRYNEDDLCAQCARHESQPAAVDLDRLVAGLLLTHSALHGEEPCNLREQLEMHGVYVDSWAVQSAVRRAERRHGIVARGVRGRPGYAVVEWERRYRPPNWERPRDACGRFAGATGAVASLLHCSETEAEVPAGQVSLYDLLDAGSKR